MSVFRIIQPNSDINCNVVALIYFINVGCPSSRTMDFHFNLFPYRNLHEIDDPSKTQFTDSFIELPVYVHVTCKQI